MVVCIKPLLSKYPCPVSKCQSLNRWCQALLLEVVNSHRSPSLSVFAAPAPHNGAHLLPHFCMQPPSATISLPLSPHRARLGLLAMPKVTALAFFCTLILKKLLLVLATLVLFSLIFINMLLNLHISKAVWIPRSLFVKLLIREAAIALPLLIEQRLHHRNFHL